MPEPGAAATPGARKAADGSQMEVLDDFDLRAQGGSCSCEDAPDECSWQGLKQVHWGTPSAKAILKMQSGGGWTATGTDGNREAD